jgi:hypothetical protein
MYKRVLLLILLFATNINGTLSQIVSPKKFIYGEAFSFSEGLAAVKKGNKYGYINRKGELVLPFVYDSVRSFKEGLAAVKQNGEYVFIDKNGQIIFSYDYDLPINKIGDFKEGWLSVMRIDTIWSAYKWWGVIDKKGKEVIPLGKYSYIYPLNEGVAMVYGARTDERYGYINREGDEITSLYYPMDFIGNEMREGLLFKDDFSTNERGYWDKNMNLVFSCSHKEGCRSRFSFCEDMVRVQYDKYGFRNRKGELVIPMTYDHAEDFSEDLVLVVLNDKYGYIDKQGKVVIPFVFDTYFYNHSNLWWYGDSFQEGMAIVKKDKKYGFINKKGELIVPYQYDEVGRFKEGLAWVKQNGQYGFVNKKGELIVPCQYDSVNSYSEGFAAVKKNEKWGFIDQNGSVLPLAGAGPRSR